MLDSLMNIGIKGISDPVFYQSKLSYICLYYYHKYTSIFFKVLVMPDPLTP